FASELAAARLTIPVAAADQMDDDYFNRWTALLSHPSFPPTITDTLISIETSARPENWNAIEEIASRRFPNVSVSPQGLERTLDVFFLCPEDLNRFRPSPQAVPPVELPSPVPSELSEVKQSSSAEIGVNPCSSVVEKNLKTENCTLNTPPSPVALLLDD